MKKHTYKHAETSYSPVMYVKLPTYVRQWFYGIYGDPAVIPREWSLYEIMLAELRPADLSRPTKPTRFCQDVFEEPAILQIDPETRKDYAAIRLPQSVYINGRPYQVNGRWTLTERGAKAFRKDAISHFWWDLDRYIYNTAARATADRKNRGIIVPRVKLEDTINQFLQYRHISLVESETVRRQYSRISAKKRNRQENFS